MKTYTTSSLRNVGIAGHGDTGKTQLVSSLLYTAGMTPRLGKVAEGSTVTDWDDEEIARKISIQTGIAFAEWARTGSANAAEKTKINFLDTPGYSTFVNETRTSLIAADAALVLVDAVAGVQVVTEKVWDYCTEYGQPRAHRHQLDGPGTREFRARAGFGARGVWPRGGARAASHRRREAVSGRGGFGEHESADLHAGRRWARQSGGDSRGYGRGGERGPRKAGGDGCRRRRRADGRVLRGRNAAGGGSYQRFAAGLSGAAAFPGDDEFGAAQYRQRRAAQSDRGRFSRSRWARGTPAPSARRAGRAVRWSERSPIPSICRSSCSRRFRIRSPGASATSR